MSRITNPKGRLMANWLVLMVNILLLAFLLSTRLVRSDRSAPVVRKDAQIMGMDVYCQRSPFAVFVNKDFPHNNGFAFTRYGLPFFLTCEDVTDAAELLLDGDDHKSGQTTQDVMLGFGEDYFTVSCVYSVRGDRVRVDELLLTRNDAGRTESFFDLNADGFPDLRLTVDQKQNEHRSEIWYGGKWQEALGQGKKYEKQLLDGEKVSFDRQGGLWGLAAKRRATVITKGRKEAQASKK